MLKKATFAGGCFWCMVPPFKGKKGILDIISGYSLSGEGESEAVQINFDDELISYKELLDIFWRQIDPTDNNGQFYDRGIKYQTAIYYHDETQKKLAELSKKEMQDYFDKQIATKIIRFKEFRAAADYHQDFHIKHSLQYELYKKASGRKSYLEKVWGRK